MDELGVRLCEAWAGVVVRTAGIAAPGKEAVEDESQLREWFEAVGIGDELVARSLAEVLGVPYSDRVEAGESLAEFTRRVPIAMARRYRVIPARATGGVALAICGVEGFLFADTVSRLLHEPVRPIAASSSSVLAAINAGYQAQAGGAGSLIDSLEDSPELQAIRSLVQRVDLLDMSGRAPVIQLVNMVLFDAVKAGASDIHIQPYEESLVVRFRIDGILFDQFTIPKAT